MNVWQIVPNNHYPIAGLSTVEHAEFGRSMADVFPIPGEKKWEIVVDGEIVGLVDDHEAAVREAEIDAWNSEANSLYARRTRC